MTQDRDNSHTPMLRRFLTAFALTLLLVNQPANASQTLPGESTDTTRENPDLDLTVYQEQSPWAITLFDENPREDQAHLWDRTKLMFGLGVGVLGSLALMPDSVTNWDKSELKPGRQWWDNVKAGPVWDEDDWYLNYVGHPYFGGVYYITARTAGYNQWNSFFYSFLMSTFYWEYGIEAFAEVPSIQDLIVTPVGGWLYGEWAYQKKLKILNNDSKVWGSERWGSTALFFLDPVDSIYQWINGDKEQPVIEDLSVKLALSPTFYEVNETLDERKFLGVVISFRI